MSNFESFKLWLEVEEIRSRAEAFKILGISPTSNKEEIKIARNKMARLYHPDINKSPEALDQMKRVNMAFDFIDANKPDKYNPTRSSSQTTEKPKPEYKSYTNSSSYHREKDDDAYFKQRREEKRKQQEQDDYLKYKKERESGIPPWATDPRGTFNVGDGFKDMNFCLKNIYEKSIKSGPVEKWTLMSFDGYFPRLGFTAKTNVKNLGYAAEVLHKWTGDIYQYLIILGKSHNTDTLKVLKIKNKDVSKDNIFIDWEKIKQESDINPWNSKEFKKVLLHLLDKHL